MIRNLFIFSVLSITSFSFAQIASHPVISEICYLARTGINEEFVELYNPTPDSIQLEDWEILYKSKTGSNWSVKEQLTDEHLLRPFGYFLWGGDAVVPQPDVAESSSRSVGLSNSGGHVALRNPAGEVVDKAGWLGASDPEGFSFDDKTEAGGTLERKASSASTSESMQPNGGEANVGNGLDSDVNSEDFVLQPPGFVNPQNSHSLQEPDPFAWFGAGSAQFDPQSVFAGQSVETQLIVQSGPEQLIRKIVIVIPDQWGWKDRPDQIVIEDAKLGEAIQIRTDTVIIADVNLFGSETGSIRFQDLTAPDSAQLSIWTVLTATVDDSSVRPIQKFPQIQIKPEILPIADLHANDAQGIPALFGQAVSVQGVITAASGVFAENYTEVFIQDATGGVKIYDLETRFHLSLGDSVTLTGLLQQYHGMTEIVPDWNEVFVHSTPGTLPEPLVLTCAEASAAFHPDATEPHEGRLIRINDAIYNADNSTISDLTGVCTLYLDPDAQIPDPSGKVDIIGLLTQYRPEEVPPFMANYSLTPRFPEDVIPHEGLRLIQQQISSWKSDGVTLSWRTNVMSTAVIHCGSSGSIDQTIVVDQPDSLHVTVIRSLQPGTIYQIRMTLRNNNDSLVVPVQRFITSSHMSSTGEIDAWFNGSVEMSAGETIQAAGNQDFTDRLVSRIQSAKFSIDACFMKLTEWDIRDALIEAHQQHVNVRFICDNDYADREEIKALQAAGIPVIHDAFGENNGEAIMHHKFAVFDHRDATSFSDDRVWTGSFNLTYYGNFPEPWENVIEIQDQAMAELYTQEFEKMWGSETDEPDASQSRFGDRKTDNLPHQLMIGGTLVEVYMSPSDGTTEAIDNAIQTADSTLQFCMYSFTKFSLAQTVAECSLNPDIQITGIFDADQINSDGQYSQWPFLSGQFPETIRCNMEPGGVHHKYCIIDAAAPSSDPIVITGSHNWTNSAEYRNDENCLIIHHADLAVQYAQEFRARYKLSTSGCTESLSNIGSELPTWQLFPAFPNPFNHRTLIRFKTAQPADIHINVIDTQGRFVRTLAHSHFESGEYQTAWEGINNNNQPVGSGVYLIQISAAQFHQTRKVIFIQ